jgi:hypothetical protein
MESSINTAKSCVEQMNAGTDADFSYKEESSFALRSVDCQALPETNGSLDRFTGNGWKSCKILQSVRSYVVGNSSANLRSGATIFQVVGSGRAVLASRKASLSRG